MHNIRRAIQLEKKSKYSASNNNLILVYEGYILYSAKKMEDEKNYFIHLREFVKRGNFPSSIYESFSLFSIYIRSNKLSS